MTFIVIGKDKSPKLAQRYHPVYFSIEYSARIKEFADRAGVSKSGFCKQCIEYAIDNMEEPVKAAAE